MDPKLNWLQENFLGYLSSWKKEVDERPKFTPSDKQNMFLSSHTFEGHKITVHSITSVIKFLLNKGASFILTSHFNHDMLEQEFSKQQYCGGGNENPTVEQFNNTAKH